jgi:hypothetical protein
VIRARKHLVALPATREVFVALLLLSSGAFAQTIADDFESGGLLFTDTPPGRWNSLNLLRQPQDSAAETAAAAHRGDAGLRVIDMNTQGMTPNAEVELGYQAAAGISSGDYCVRGWLRVTQQNGVGQIFPVQVETSQPQSADICEFAFDFGKVEIDVGGFDGPGSFTLYRAGDLPDGAWHLYECHTLGIGSASGARELYVDGVLLDNNPEDLTGLTLQQLNIGEAYGDVDFQGTLDFDDVRTSIGRPATFVVVSGVPASAAVGECVSLSVELRDVAGHPAAAPYDVVAGVSVSGVSAQLFSDACATPSASATVKSGQSTGAIWLRATSVGQAVIAASHLDFLSAPQQQFAIVQGSGAGGGNSGGGGSPAASRKFSVGCGCAQPGPLVLLMGLRWFRRRPARRR